MRHVTPASYKQTDSPANRTPLLSDRHNIVFIADEAHRSHYGFTPHVSETTGFIRYGFAEYIRQALPNASSIGFTGTPIFAENAGSR